MRGLTNRAPEPCASSGAGTDDAAARGHYRGRIVIGLHVLGELQRECQYASEGYRDVAARAATPATALAGNFKREPDGTEAIEQELSHRDGWGRHTAGRCQRIASE